MLKTGETESQPEPKSLATDDASPRPGASAKKPDRVAMILGSVGRFLITSGVVVFLLVGYLLWGTNYQTTRSQQSLANEFEGIDKETPSPTSGPTTTVAEDQPVPAAAIEPPKSGDVIGSFRIPAIGRNAPYYTVEDTGVEELKRGAGHYAGTPLPGQAGNAAVAGHRTTYGAPLHNVDKLKAGDLVYFKTIQGEFTYKVRDTQIVEPSNTEVLQPQNPTAENPAGDNLLTLTACHPKFSAAQRIIITSVLVSNPVPEIAGQAAQARKTLADHDAEEGVELDVIANEPVLRFPGANWGLVCIGAWSCVRVLSARLRRMNGPWFLPYLLGTPVCLVMLFVFFESFSYESFARAVGIPI